MGERGPATAPLDVERWHNFDSSINAVSLGFLATAVLISMFLVMALYERFFRPAPSPPPPLLPTLRRGRRRRPEDAHRWAPAAKLDCPSPKMSVYAKGVSVLMPGHSIPTFIAHPAPAPCPPERISWPPHDRIPFDSYASNPS